MDLIWDCMNIASRISKQIEASDNLVPKHQQQTSGVTPSADLQELVTTVNSVRTILVPFVTSSKKSKGVAELPAFELCLKTLKQTLNDLFDYFKDLEKEFSIYTWKTQKVKLYQIDFLLKQKLDQFANLFNIEESKDPKAKTAKLPTGASFIIDPEGKEWWCKAFGESTILVPWNAFFPALESGVGISLKEDEESFKAYLDPTKIDHVSAFSFSVFLKWFGPFKLASPRMIEAIHGGLLCGFVPAVEANLLLENKREGTYLIRCSKTQPGSFAVTFVDNALKVKHCLLYAVHPSGLTLKNPPTVYQSLKEFADAHTSKLKRPLGNRWTSSKNMPEFDFGRMGQRQPETSTPTETKEQAPPGNNNNNGPAIASDTCVVCMDAPFETVFLECGHLACCHKCSVQLKLCPICRNPIARIVPIFRAT